MPPNRPLLQAPHKHQRRKITCNDWHLLAFRTVEIFSLKAAEWAATKGLRLLVLYLMLRYGSPLLNTFGKEILAFLLSK